MKTACPCCHGEKWLYVHGMVDEEKIPIMRFKCTHCDGTGEIENELPDEDRTDTP